MKRVVTVLFLPLLLVVFSSCSIRTEKADYASFRAAQKTFETSVGPMAYSDQGQGPPIILLHGVPTSSWMYRKVIPGLAENHRVIAVDLIGYGSSAKPKGNPENYQATEQARRVCALAKSLGLSSYSLAFHDMGGLVAWEMLRQDPKAISNLIVLNTIVQKEGFNPPDFKPGSFTEMLAKSFVHKLTNQAVLKLTFRSLGLHAEDSLNGSECFGYLRPLREGSDAALYAFYTSLNPTLYERLEQNKTHMRKFQGKTLVLWGAKDEILTTKQIPFLQENLRIPQKNVHIYKQHDHFLPEEAPEEVVQKITTFLAEEGS